jgi:hypothetical protein
MQCQQTAILPKIGKDITMANKPAKAPGLTLAEIANDSIALGKLVTTTITAYTKVAKSLHETACALLYHVAQGNDPSVLNRFYEGLRVNDRTALRVWFGQHTSFVDLNSNSTRNWIKWSEKKGFELVKGCEAYRKDMFLVTDHAEGKTTLIDLKPFYEKDVKDKDALTLETLVKMLQKAAEQVEKKSKNEGIALPADILTLLPSIKNVAAKELAAIERIAE